MFSNHKRWISATLRWFWSRFPLGILEFLNILGTRYFFVDTFGRVGDRESKNIHGLFCSKYVEAWALQMFWRSGIIFWVYFGHFHCWLRFPKWVQGEKSWSSHRKSFPIAKNIWRRQTSTYLGQKSPWMFFDSRPPTLPYVSSKNSSNNFLQGLQRFNPYIPWETIGQSSPGDDYRRRLANRLPGDDWISTWETIGLTWETIGNPNRLLGDD